ncbi:MAG: LTA synthase family protein [Bacteroidales bacterium]
MKARIVLFLKIALFWLVFAWIARAWFLIFHSDNFPEPSLSRVVAIYINGFKLDLSFVGYIMALTGLIMTLTYPFSGRWLYRVLLPFTLLFLIFLGGICVADAELYSHWGYRMDATPLLYLKNPKEAFVSVETRRLISLSLATIGFILLGLFLFVRFFGKTIHRLQGGKVYGAFLFLILTASMIIPIRGGFGVAPINSGNAYFSEKQFYNHAAINVFWNVGHALSKVNKTQKTYTYIDKKEAERIFKKLYASDSSSVQLLEYNKSPNVVIILLESFTNKIIEPLGGIKGITPQFNQLASEGVLFSNFYANADRSDKGIVAILSSFPALPANSIIKYPEKTAKLPALTSIFNKRGYHSSFYYGGDIDFANMRSYVINTGFQEIISQKDFPQKLNDSKWGVHDEHVFQRVAEDIANEEEPFFKVFFTLSSHDPFEVPMDQVIAGEDRAHKFMNSAFYTDKCLGAFFQQVKELPQWQNTLFVLVADHGSPRPGNSKVYEPEKYTIPMLWLGGGVPKGQVIDVFGSQMDMGPTVLGQLNYQDDYAPYFGKDMLQPGSHFAFYTYNDGFSFLSKEGYVIYDNHQKGRIAGESETMEEKGKVLLQTLSSIFSQ